MTNPTPSPREALAQIAALKGTDAFRAIFSKLIAQDALSTPAPPDPLREALEQLEEIQAICADGSIDEGDRIDEIDQVAGSAHAALSAPADPLGGEEVVLWECPVHGIVEPWGKGLRRGGEAWCATCVGEDDSDDSLSNVPPLKRSRFRRVDPGGEAEPTDKGGER